MLRKLGKLVIASIIALFAFQNSYAKGNKYVVLRDNIKVAKIYYRTKSGDFVHRSFLKNRGNRAFLVSKRLDKASVCGGKAILDIYKIGWVCEGVFDYRDELELGDYSVYGVSGNKLKKDSGQDEITKKSDSLLDNPRYVGLRELLKKSELQVVEPGPPRVVVLSKNYTNRINCEGEIEKIIYNQEHLVEIDYDKHNIFVKAPKNKMLQFLSDLVIKCSGNIFQLNAAFDSALPSQQVSLKMDWSKAVINDKYKEDIKKWSALSFEVKVANLLKLAYSGKHLPYWVIKEDFYFQDEKAVLLKKIITNLDDFVIYDFVYRTLDKKTALEYMKNFSLKNNSRYVASGIVKNKDSLRVFLVVQEG